MVSTTYRTGSWLGIVRAGTVIVLEPATDPAIITSLWDHLGNETPTLHGVLNAVTSKLGPELVGMPQFAILVQTDRLHAILRGEISLVARLDGDEQEVSGRDVTTWSERSLATPDSAVLTLSESSQLADGSTEFSSSGLDDASLPVGEAVIRLQELCLGGPGSLTRSRTSGGHAMVLPSRPPAPPTVLAGAGAGAGAGAWAEAGAEAATGAGTADQASWQSEETEQDAVDEATESESGQDALGSDERGSDAAPEVEEDVFAGFAVASDAEWNAQLGSPSALPLPEHDDDGMGFVSSDLAQTIYPGHEGSEDHEHALSEVASGAESADFGADDEFGAFAGEMPDASGTGSSGTGSEQEAGPGSGQENAGGSLDETDADGFTTNYDHLFGQTMLRSVEDAAIRYDEDGNEIPKESETGASSQESAAEPNFSESGSFRSGGTNAEYDGPENGARGNAEAGHSDKISTSTQNGGHASDGTGAPAQASAESATEHDGLQADVPVAPWQPPSGVLIDSVPWLTNSGNYRNPAAETEAVSLNDGMDYPASAPDSGFANDEDPDHDGHTVMVNRAALPEAPAVEPLASRPPTGPMVLARLCPNGHANPPTRSQCSQCGATINSEPREVGRPRLGRMHISTGEILDLDYSLIIGRQPSVSRVMGGVMPRLVQVHSASGDISRSHVEVRLDGWEVMLVDLKATNGTVLVREGQAPRRLGQGEQAILLDGDIAELGDGVSLLFEGLL